MSEHRTGPDEDFVASPHSGQVGYNEAGFAGSAEVNSLDRERMRQGRVANPDDPPVPPPLRGRHGRVPAPDSYLLGRMAIVQGQVYIVGVILIMQLWIITTALFELLSGRPQNLWALTIASGTGFAIALVVMLWPGRRSQEL